MELVAQPAELERASALRMVRVVGFEAAVGLPAADAEAYRRRFTVLFVDESRQRRGGIGRVSRVTNARGEAFALKALILPAREEWESEQDHARRIDLLKAAFDQEYECHRALSPLKGFPRLYGRGVVDGAPVLIMEWIEGETLAGARRRLAVDDAGRVSPLTAARIGRDLFELIDRMDCVGGGYVHRDISPANVMVRTTRLSVQEQADEGVFDLCLIDFGSTASVEPEDTSLTSTYGVTRKATADYAPPEMLTDDVAGVEKLRRASEVDVYAAGGVLYELLGGRTPFDLGGADAPYRVKTETRPKPLLAAHAAGSDVGAVLLREPEAAVAVSRAAVDLAVAPGTEEVREALDFVDAPLVEMVEACLEVKQQRRPTAEAMRDGLATFAQNYAENVGRSLRFEPLVPCTADGAWFKASSPFVIRRWIRSIGKAAAFAVLVVVAVSAGLLLDGARATFEVGSFLWSGKLVGALVSAALALPLACGFALRGRQTFSRQGFLRATCGVALGAAVTLALGQALSFDAGSRAFGLSAALFAALAAAWCPFVLDYAMAAAVPGRAKRRLLPDRKRPKRAGMDGARAAALDAAEAAEGVAGNDLNRAKTAALEGEILDADKPEGRE